MNRPIPWNCHWNIHVIRTQMINSIWNHVGWSKFPLILGNIEALSSTLFNQDLKPFYFPVWYTNLNVPVSDLPNYFASVSIKLLSWLKRARKPWILRASGLVLPLNSGTHPCIMSRNKLLLLLIFFSSTWSIFQMTSSGTLANKYQRGSRITGQV